MTDVTIPIRARIQAAQPTTVWTPFDFLDLGARDAVDKTLQRLAGAGALRRIDRGLYDRPRVSTLTKQPGSVDYRQVLDALARRDQVRMLVDGLTAANDLGLTTAVPARVIVHTDARRQSISLGNVTIQFKLTAPSKLYWAGRPAMRVVQALHWLKDILATDREDILTPVVAILAAPVHGSAIRKDLRLGLPTLPAWMQRVVRDLLQRVGSTGRGAALDATPVDDTAAHAGRRRSKSGLDHGVGHPARQVPTKARGVKRRDRAQAIGKRGTVLQRLELRLEARGKIGRIRALFARLPLASSRNISSSDAAWADAGPGTALLKRGIARKRTA